MKSHAEFIQKASVSNLFEIKSSELALSRAQNPEVKRFAERMIKDHSQTAEELKNAVSKVEMDKSLIAESLNAKYESKMEELEREDGEAFEKEFVKIQRDAHESAVALFRDYLENGDDDALKTFARNTLPNLEEHQEMVSKLAA